MPELSYRSSYPVRVLQCITLGGDCTAQSHARTPLPMALTGSDSSRHCPSAGTSLTALASLIALVPFLVSSHLCAFRQQELTGPRRRPFRETCSSLARQSWVRAPHPMMSVVPSHHALLPPPPPPSTGPKRYGRVGGNRAPMVIRRCGDVQSIEIIGSIDSSHAARARAALYPGFDPSCAPARARWRRRLWLLDALAPPCQRP